MGLKLRSATAAVAASHNPVLEVGELGYETDTGKVKFGDGVTAWNSLPYWSSGGVPSTRQVATGTGLLGGGDLSADRTLTPDFGAGAGKVTQGNDSRLSDARTPTAHASSHGSGGSDPVTVAESQVTGLVTDLAGKLAAASNLSDLGSLATALANLGLPSPGYTAKLLSEASVNGGGGTGDQTMWSPASIAAGSLAAGQVYELLLGGNFDNIASSGVFNVKVKQGSTTIATIQVAVASQSSAATNTPWWAQLTLVVDATGSSGGLTAIGGTIIVTSAAGGINPRAIRQINTLLNLSSGLSLVVAGQFGTGNSGNVIRATRGLLRQVA